tara:strand:- start:209 stop:334 length:126 start_codon:yes stop_codon:yes gene_type:complete
VIYPHFKKYLAFNSFDAQTDSLPAFSDVLIAYFKSSYGIDL